MFLKAGIQVVPGTKNLQELGPTLFFIKTLLVNSFLAVIVPQIAFTYVLIYWLLPNYFFKRRNPLVVISVAAAVLLIFYVVAVAFKHAPPLYNQVSGQAATLFGLLMLGFEELL